MSKIKQIINCETNKKFIIVSHETGYLRIPDVIFYLLLESGEVKVMGTPLYETLPKIGEEFKEGDDMLLGWISKNHLEKHANFIYENDGDHKYAVQEARDFLEKAKTIVPYLNIQKDVEEFR